MTLEIGLGVALAYAFFVTIGLAVAVRHRLRPEIVVERQVEIREMEVNEIGWTVPWAFYEVNGRIYVNGNYTAYKTGGGTCKVMFVKRLGGVEVDEWPEGEVLKTSGGYWGDAVPVLNMKSRRQELWQDRVYFVSGQEVANGVNADGPNPQDP